MGGGSKSSQEKTTNVTTTTTTNIRDIGLTGQHALDMAAILETGATDRTYLVGESINKLIQGAGEGWQRLIGGASDIANNLVLTGAGEAQEIRAEAKGESEFIKVAPWLALAGVGLFVLAKGVK